VLPAPNDDICMHIRLRLPHLGCALPTGYYTARLGVEGLCNAFRTVPNDLVVLPFGGKRIWRYHR
jgi:hypothetical protein